MTGQNMIIDDICWPEDRNPDDVAAFLQKLDRLIGHHSWLHFLPDHSYDDFPDPSLIEQFGSLQRVESNWRMKEYWTVPYTARQTAFARFFHYISAELVVVAADDKLEPPVLKEALNARDKQSWFAVLYFDSGDLMRKGSLV